MDDTHSTLQSRDLLPPLRPVLAICCCTSSHPRSAATHPPICYCEVKPICCTSSSLWTADMATNLLLQGPSLQPKFLPFVLNLKLSSFKVYNYICFIRPVLNLNPSLPEFNLILWLDSNRSQYVSDWILSGCKLGLHLDWFLPNPNSPKLEPEPDFGLP